MFEEVLYHRLKYFLSPQLDLYKNIARQITRWAETAGYDPRQGPKILDYGCGTGFGTLMLRAASNDVAGIDVDMSPVLFAKEVLGHVASFHKEDWSSEQAIVAPCDVIVCIEVIEHVSDVEALMRNFRAALLDGGLLFLSTLNHNSQYRKNDCHVGRFCVHDFRELVERHFQPVRMTDYTLEEELGDESTRTPVVAVWCGK